MKWRETREMATDHSGKIITPEMVEGLERFAQNNVAKKLCRTSSVVMSFEIDSEYRSAHEEDAEVYESILPSQVYDTLFPVEIGETFIMAKQYAGEIINSKSVLKQFRITSIDKEIDQDTTRFCMYITVWVEPVEVITTIEQERE